MAAVSIEGSEAVDFGVVSNTTPVTQNITVPAGCTYMLVGVISWWDGGSPSGDIADVSLNPAGSEQTFTYAISSVSSNDDFSAIYVLDAPATGAAVLEFTSASSAIDEDVQAHVLYVSGEHLTTIISDTQATSGSSSNNDITVTSVAGADDLVFACCYEWSDDAGSTGASWNATNATELITATSAATNTEQHCFSATSLTTNAVMAVDSVDGGSLCCVTIEAAAAGGSEGPSSPFSGPFSGPFNGPFG
jgi:hypothetical protein